MATAKALVSRPNLASKRWVYEQYDSMVGTVNRSTNRLVMPPWAGRSKASLEVDYLPPRRGRPAEGWRRRGGSGAEHRLRGRTPSATTNCQLRQPLQPGGVLAVRRGHQGMGDACRAFESPVTGGNVSF